ncbi:geranylgeranyl reductase family protein [Candidatus Micrarchaeota archaeon]|nr:geranylgeranyl reductase family protein [Candidatus Micrarchaeota archaeon]
MDYDVIVVGGGPSGSSCTAFLSKAGKKVLLLDRARFPREKICGDGISGRSVSLLKELGIFQNFKDAEHTDMYGVTFSSPDGTVVPVGAKDKGDAPGFVCRRIVFDNILFQNAKKLAAKTIEEFIVTDLITEGGKVVGVKGNHKGKEKAFRAKLVVGADGAAGVTARKLGAANADGDHQYAGLRAYYENVDGMGKTIELHFVKETIPGYFWIFPLPGKRANVGIAITVTEMKNKKINLVKAMEEIINANPVFRPRFNNAKRTTSLKSWILPLATKKVKSYGNGYVLIGDAASLIDPFTGEGIGNALTSGKVSAQVIAEALNENDFSEAKLSQYRKRLFDIIAGEVSANARLQMLGKHEFLLNIVIGKAKRSDEIKAVISDAILDPKDHGRLSDPVFLLKALFA